MRRFCSEDYEPFDVHKVKKYVVDDEYTRPSEVSHTKLFEYCIYSGSFCGEKNSNSSDFRE